MDEEKAIVRKHIERISGVSRTWIEWHASGPSNAFRKVLVVEVDFNLDPNSSTFAQGMLDAIADTTASVLANETTMVISELRIVPKSAR